MLNLNLQTTFQNNVSLAYDELAGSGFLADVGVVQVDEGVASEDDSCVDASYIKEGFSRFERGMHLGEAAYAVHRRTRVHDNGILSDLLSFCGGVFAGVSVGLNGVMTPSQLFDHRLAKARERSAPEIPVRFEELAQDIETRCLVRPLLDAFIRRMLKWRKIDDDGFTDIERGLDDFPVYEEEGLVGLLRSLSEDDLFLLMRRFVLEANAREVEAISLVDYFVLPEGAEETYLSGASPYIDPSIAPEVLPTHYNGLVRNSIVQEALGRFYGNEELQRIYKRLINYKLEIEVNRYLTTTSVDSAYLELLSLIAVVSLDDEGFAERSLPFVQEELLPSINRREVIYYLRGHYWSFPFLHRVGINPWNDVPTLESQAGATLPVAISGMTRILDSNYFQRGDVVIQVSADGRVQVYREIQGVDPIIGISSTGEADDWALYFYYSQDRFYHIEQGMSKGGRTTDSPEALNSISRSNDITEQLLAAGFVQESEGCYVRTVLQENGDDLVLVAFVADGRIQKIVKREHQYNRLTNTHHLYPLTNIQFVYGQQDLRKKEGRGEVVFESARGRLSIDSHHVRLWDWQGDLAEADVSGLLMDACHKKALDKLLSGPPTSLAAVLAASEKEEDRVERFLQRPLTQDIPTDPVQLYQAEGPEPEIVTQRHYVLNGILRPEESLREALRRSEQIAEESEIDHQELARELMKFVIMAEMNEYRNRFTVTYRGQEFEIEPETWFARIESPLDNSEVALQDERYATTLFTIRRLEDDEMIHLNAALVYDIYRLGFYRSYRLERAEHVEAITLAIHTEPDQLADFIGLP